jgi:hypothetical protein
MSKLTTILLTALLTARHSSCTTSLFSISTYKNIITDKRIEGVWKTNDMEFTIEKIPDTILQRIIAPRTNPLRRIRDSILYYQSYMANYEKSGISYQFNLELTRINHNLFIDIGPAGFESHLDETLWQERYGGKLEYLPTFTMAKVEMPSDSVLVLNFFNAAFIKDRFEEGKIRMKYEENKMFDLFLITASSEELQHFIYKYGDDHRFYDTKTRVLLKRIR